MDRALPFAAAFLVGVCVFAWLAGPVLEARFGTEALLVAYGGVAVGAAGTTYVLIRRIDARIGDGANAARDGSGANDVDPEVESIATTDDAENAGDGGANADRHAGRSGGDGGDRAGDTVAVSLDELEALDVEREVRELKAERASNRGESGRGGRSGG